MGTIQPSAFGTTSDGHLANLYQLSNDDGMSVTVCDYGALITKIVVPDANSNPIDVVLGYDTLARYEVNGPNFGALVGRNANRIKGATFTLNGQEYKLADNEKGNSLHSGPHMWHKRMWSVKEAAHNEEASSNIAGYIELRLLSPDGDQGFPGELDFSVRYELTKNNTLRCIYSGTPNKDTVINPTQHSYFNLNGHASGTALDHTLRVNADSYTVCDSTLCPTGEIASVEGAPLDLREGKMLRPGIESDFAPIVAAKGYDHDYVLASGTESTEQYLCEPRHAATLTGDKTGISCKVWTDAPSIQIYTGNYVGGEIGKDGARYQDWDAVCLETQFSPNAINIPSFDQPVFGPERPYKSITEFRFSR